MKTARIVERKFAEISVKCTRDCASVAGFCSSFQLNNSSGRAFKLHRYNEALGSQAMQPKARSIFAKCSPSSDALENEKKFLEDEFSFQIRPRAILIRSHVKRARWVSAYYVLICKKSELLVERIP
ncbi:hypothetical protein AcV7_010327 [Taiwanofungus camphoratus]|nr:hypothetical protein AcV7_010327 [Antrodia cinnamomea]